MKAPGAPTGDQPYGAPSLYEKGVVKNISKTLPQYLSASSRTPLQELDGIITPNGLFFERHHGGVPAIDPAQHRLTPHGLVHRPLVVHHGGDKTLSVAIAHPLYRMLGNPSST